MTVRDKRLPPGGDNRAGDAVRHSDPPRGTIVVLDDDPMFRRNVARALRSEGYVVADTPDVAGLSALLDELQVDLILADSRLADGSDGWREAEALASRHGGVPVIAVSGYDADSIEATGGSVHRGYVLKGSSAFLVLQAVEEALSGA